MEIINKSGDVEITLPEAREGLSYKFINNGEGQITIHPAQNDTIRYSVDENTTLSDDEINIVENVLLTVKEGVWKVIKG